MGVSLFDPFAVGLHLGFEVARLSSNRRLPTLGRRLPPKHLRLRIGTKYRCGASLCQGVEPLLGVVASRC